MSNLQSRVENLSDEQRKLLARWLDRLAPAENSQTSANEGKSQLLAYVQFNKDSKDTGAETLQEYARANLPNHMVPDVIIPVETFPRLPNGKLDVASLPTSNPKPAKTHKKLDSSRSEIEAILLKIWSDILDDDMLDVADNFFEFGGDSIASIRLVSKVRSAGLAMEPYQLIDHPTIAELASVISYKDTPPSEIETRSEGQAIALPIQQWLLERSLNQPHHWNMSRFFKLDAKITAEISKKAAHEIILQHDALRSSFAYQNNHWHQSYADSTSGNIFESVILDGGNPSSIEENISEFHSGFDLTSGPLIKFIHFHNNSNQEAYLLIAAHHLVIDQVSWNIITEDFETISKALIDNSIAVLPTKSTSTTQWANALHEYANSAQGAEDVKYWAGWEHGKIGKLSVTGNTGNKPTEATTAVTKFNLNKEHSTSLIGIANDAYSTQPLELILAALIKTLSTETENKIIAFDMEAHGRESIRAELDLSRTVGWLTSYFPVCFDLQNKTDISEEIKYIKDQFRSIPNRGLGYGAARYLSDDQSVIDTLSPLQPNEILFNFLGAQSSTGRTDSLMSFREINGDHNRHPENLKSHRIEINCWIGAEGLQGACSFSKALDDISYIQTLSDCFTDNLQEIITHCLDTESGGYTPSDFSELDMDQSELDDLLSEL